MKFSPTLLLFALIATLLAPAASLAEGKKYVVRNVQGKVHISLHGPGINAEGPVPIDRWRIEFQEGPYDPAIGRKQFLLTRVHLGLRNFYIPETSEGRIDFQDVALELRDQLRWWAEPIGIHPATRGNWLMWISKSYMDETGDPTFLAGGIVTNKKRWVLHDADRVAEQIRGHINLDSGTFEMEMTFKDTIAAPWWAPWADDFTRTFAVTLKGEFEDLFDMGFERGPQDKPVKPIQVPPLKGM